MYTERNYLRKLNITFFFYQNSENLCFFVHILIDITIKYVNEN